MTTIFPRWNEGTDRFQSALNLASQIGLGDTGRWLDYGCGAGAFAAMYAGCRPSWEVLGYDGDTRAIAMANNLHRRPNVRFEVKSYDYYNEMSPSSFDGISFLEVLEHLPNPSAVLASFHRALTPDGVLLLSTPNALGWNYLRRELRRVATKIVGYRNNPGYLDVLKQRAYDPTTDAGHIGQYSVEILERLLRANGFSALGYETVALGSSPLQRLFPDTIVMIAKKIA